MDEAACGNNQKKPRCAVSSSLSSEGCIGISGESGSIHRVGIEYGIHCSDDVGTASFAMECIRLQSTEASHKSNVDCSTDVDVQLS